VARDIQCADGEAGSQHWKTRRFLKAIAGGLEKASQQEGIQHSRERKGVHTALVIPEDEIVQGHNGYGRETVWPTDSRLQLAHVIVEPNRAVRGTPGTPTQEGRGSRLTLAKATELAELAELAC
jgi:hypothetical protein